MVERIEERFPGLQTSPFRVTSPATRDYNCIAWAAGDTTRWWWPDPDPDNDAVYWPSNIPIEETTGAFAAALATPGLRSVFGGRVRTRIREGRPVRHRHRAGARCPAASERTLDEQTRSE
jgi:hypothetical protein